jgi:hypothetical protein
MFRKIFLFSFFILFHVNIYSQKENPFENLKGKSTTEISEYINQNAVSENDKALLAYKIITHNIRYDYFRFLTGLSPFYEPNKILKKGKTTCMGYSLLYEDILKKLGIKCEIVYGFVKDLDFQKKKFFNESNHAWNAVYIENNWISIDATWGAGYTSQRKLFAWMHIKNQNIIPWISKFNHIPNLDQFNIKTDQLLFTRLPEVPFWQLSASPMPMSTFIKEDKNIEIFIKNKKKTSNYFYVDTINSYLNDTSLYEFRYAIAAVKFHKKNNLPLLICRNKINENLLVKTQKKINELEDKFETNDFTISENDFDENKEIIDSIIDTHKDISSSKNAVSSYRKKTKKVITEYYKNSEKQIVYTYIFKIELLYLESLFNSRDKLYLTELKTIINEINSNSKNFKKHFAKFKKHKDVTNSEIENTENYHRDVLIQFYLHLLKLSDTVKEDKTLKEIYKIQEKFKSEIKPYISKKSDFYKKFYSKNH